MNLARLQSPAFRRSPHVVSYWEGRQLVFENYATGIRVTADPLTAVILHFFDRWRPVAALCRSMTHFAPLSLERATAHLERASLLQRRDVPLPVTERAMQNWAAWNPAAGWFHTSTKDAPYSRNPDKLERSLWRTLKRDPVPPVVKRYRGAEQVALPPARRQGEFADVLLNRRTWRHFSHRPLDLWELATLLDLTFRAQRWLNLGWIGRMPLKTSPSGGGRHPIEAYVLAPRVDGLPRGLYHYAADTHVLERLSKGATGGRVSRYLADQWWFADAAALVLMTAVFSRVQWRYRHPRAYRVALVEAGHFCQTFCLVATWLGLAPFCSLALRDSLIETDLGVDGISESVLYAAGVGRRPEGAAWTPWPTRRRASSKSARSRSASAQYRRNS